MSVPVFYTSDAPAPEEDALDDLLSAPTSDGSDYADVELSPLTDDEDAADILAGLQGAQTIPVGVKRARDDDDVYTRAVRPRTIEPPEAVAAMLAYDGTPSALVRLARAVSTTDSAGRGRMLAWALDNDDDFAVLELREAGVTLQDFLAAKPFPLDYFWGLNPATVYNFMQMYNYPVGMDRLLMAIRANNAQDVSSMLQDPELSLQLQQEKLKVVNLLVKAARDANFGIVVALMDNVEWLSVDRRMAMYLIVTMEQQFLKGLTQNAEGEDVYDEQQYEGYSLVTAWLSRKFNITPADMRQYAAATGKQYTGEFDFMLKPEPTIPVFGVAAAA